MNRERNYIIYRISNNFDEDVYIGCTFNTIAHRFNQHVAKSKRTDTKLSRKIRDVGIDNMVIVDLVSRWMTLRDARKIEGELIDLLEPTLNSQSSGKFRDVDGNWDKVAYKKEYNRERNSISIQCVCGGGYTIDHKTDHEKTNKHLSHASVFSPPSSPPPHTVPLPSIVNPEDSF